MKRSGAGAEPPLRRIHSDPTYERDRRARDSLVYHRNRTTEDIVRSLDRNAKLPLKVKRDGRIFDGNTRIKVLEERGYPVNDLPRETLDDDQG